MSEMYDVIILGGGPAGLAAGLYAARGRLKTLILEKDQSGGQIVTTDGLENYPGSVEGTTGPSLIDDMVRQCKKFGCEMVKDTIVDVELEGDVKVAKSKKAEYKGKSIIIATGVTPRKIGCPGEKELTGRGVSYCSTCDADFFEGMEVFVVGGGDSAIKEAIYLTKYARKVTIVHRRQGLRAAKVLIEEAQNHPKIEWMLDTVVEEIKGDGILESVVFKSTINDELTEIHADEDDGMMGLFVYVGSIPQTDMFKGKLPLTDSGYLISDEEMRTDIEGVYVAGDVKEKAVRQVVTAAADGAIAAMMAEEYVDELDKQ